MIMSDLPSWHATGKIGVQSYLMRKATCLISSVLKAGAGFTALLLMASTTWSQSVTEIITTYNGYWKTGIGAVSPVKPNHHHDLVAFKFNGVRYSTGVQDALLEAHGDDFVPGMFRALPMHNINGTPNGNTKIGLGALIDGVSNGRGTVPPSRSLAQYLVDGTNGLDIGTCVANLPAGTMFMPVTQVEVENIGDGVPDIVVTQIADPSTQYDRYEFTDINGQRVGNYVDIVLTNITPVGNWTADFYEATGSTILSSSFTQTDRALRLWAADFSAFGINASNIDDIAYFKITLNGNSDIAFVAYNTTTVTVEQVLDMGDLQARPRLSRPVSREPVNVSLYPNPAGETVNLTHPPASGKERILLFNTGGTPVLQATPGSGSIRTTFSVSHLPRGMYQAVYTDGHSKQARQLVIQ